MSLVELADRYFPGNNQILEHAVGQDVSLYGSFGRMVRIYPIDTQAAFFASCLMERYEKLRKDTRADLPSPNIAETAMLMAKINMIPLKEGELSLDELQRLASLSLPRSSQNGLLPTVRILDNLEEAIDWVMEVASAESMGYYNDQTKVTTEHPTGIIWQQVLNTADAAGLMRFVHPFTDPAYNGGFESSVIFDMFIEEGRIVRTGPRAQDYEIIDKKLASTMGTIYRSFSFRLGQAEVWEALSGLIEQRVFAPGNPFEPYVTITRPGLWPIGWYQDKFLVAKIPLIETNQ